MSSRIGIARGCDASRASRRPRLKTRARRRIRLQRIQNDADGAFFVSLKQTLQSENLDLTVVAVQCLLD
jgi:hypothetical protein